MTARGLSVLVALLLAGALFPAVATGHGGGVIDLNPCSRSTASPANLRVHFDAFQDGRGPFCYHVPTTGDAQIVLEFYRSLKDQKAKIIVRGASTANDTTVFDPEPMVYPGGVVSELINFSRPGRYEVIVRPAGADEGIRFPLYVGINPPLTWRIKDTILDTIEEPYLILFVLIVLLASGLYWYSDPF